ncbi:MAG: phosphotransferase [Chloroflexota bacterium]|nr:phosphotransferase [Chloroflexota bacterium]
MRPETPDDSRGDSRTFDNLIDASSRFFDAVERTEPVGSAPHLLRVRADGADFVLREWDARATPAKVNLAARALTLAGPASGDRLPVPHAVSGEVDVWAVRSGDRLVSAASWLPGRPLARYGDFRTPDGDVIDVPLPASAPAEAIVLEAVRTIGQFHSATAPLAPVAGTSASPLTRLLRESRETWTTQRREIGDRAASSPEIRRWLRCGNRILPMATEYLEQSGATAVGTAVIHGDIWPANLLIEGTGDARKLTGVVGWSSVTVGSPLIDLAHLAIHTSGWSGALAETILGAYTGVADLTPMERRLLPVVAALDLVPRVGWLLNLAFVDDRMIGHESQPVLRSGLKSLLTSLENLTQILAPESEWNQRKTIGQRQNRVDSATKRSAGKETTRARPPGSARSRPGPRPRRRKTG